jgi:hypothetical protein
MQARVMSEVFPVLETFNPLKPNKGKVILRPTVMSWCQHPPGTRDQFLFTFFNFSLDSCGFVDVGHRL